MKRAKLVAVLLVIASAYYGLSVPAGDGPKAPKRPVAKKQVPFKPWEFAAFEERLLKHQDLTYDELEKAIRKPRGYVQRLSFDPTKAEFFDRVSQKLTMTPAEIEQFKKNGFVSLDMNARHSMVSAYHDIFKKDLPILVTTDSILHALHRSFDDILMGVEQNYFYGGLYNVVAGSREELKKTLDSRPAALAENYKDVDLFLTVAINLLDGAGAGEWNRKLEIKSQTGVDGLALEILKNVQKGKMAPMQLYGGGRVIDFSQFTPRGHYTKQDVLKRYFRAMMWLGRADTGWFILPVDPNSGVICDDQRELRNSLLLMHLLDKSGSLTTLQHMDDAINFLIGRSDNLSVFQMRDLMRQEGMTALADFAPADNIKKMQHALRNGKHHRPMIVSMVLHGDPSSPGPQVPAPAEFHLFGQRFAMDSFVLSQVVFDTIVYRGRKMERRLPTGIDAMVALGNSEALPLLRGEIAQWQYSANLLACREFIDGVSPAFWKDSLYNVWLDSLRAFNTDRTSERHFPQAMKTQAWQRKELQTQLASWAELRHDTVLYVKQSYSRDSCEYPAGYVEPYPEFYARLKGFSDKAQHLFANWKFDVHPNDDRMKQIVGYFKHFSEVMSKLEGLARKELKAEPFTKEENEFLKKTLTAQPICGGPFFDGWYCKLYIDREDFEKWKPTVVDVHTDPMTGLCLEAGVGETNLCVIAIDNEQHRRVYVGPISSYYEFPHPLTDRMTDEAWRKKLETNEMPARPSWVSEFQAARRPKATAPNGQ